MPPSSRFFTSSGAAEARTDIRASSASCVVGEVVGGAHGGVLPGQPGAEQQRVVGAERDRRAGLEQRRQRHRGQVGVDAERDVGDRADLERHAGLDDPVEQRGVLGRRGRRGRAAGACRASRQLRDVLGPAQLAAVRDQQQPGPLGDRGRRRRTRRSSRAARRWRGRSRPPRGRRTARRAGPGCGRRAGAGCGWRR